MIRIINEDHRSIPDEDIEFDPDMVIGDSQKDIFWIIKIIDVVVKWALKI